VRTLWIIAGLRRSGIHAVVDWIRAALDAAAQPHLLLNNVRLHRLHPRESNVAFSADYHLSCSPHEHLLVVFEDKRLRRIAASALPRRLGGRQRRLVVLRDPYNLVASRLERTRRRRSRDTHPRRVAELWPEHAAHDPTWTRCVYNRWFSDQQYRQRLAAALKLPVCAPLPQHVARPGLGSSFDGLQYDGRAGRMPVLQRWRKFAHDPEFRQYVDHPRLAALSREVCGFDCPLEEPAAED